MQVCPIYTNGKKQSPILRDLIGDQVTINRNFIDNRLIFSNGDKHRRYRRREHETIFEEIKVVPYEKAFGILKFKEENTLKRIDKEKYFETYEKVVNSLWDSSKFNLIFHSSGWDSRLLGHFITKKWRQDPSPILFVCWGRECGLFEEIMKYHGFKEQYYEVIPFELNLYPFDFHNVWKHINGGSTHFVDCMYHVVIDHLKDKGRIPEDNLNIWTGLDNNSMFTSTLAGWYGSLHANFRRMYYSWAMRMFGFLDGIENLRPGMDFEVGKVIYSSVSRKDRMRRLLLKEVDPKLESFSYLKPIRRKFKVPDKAINNFMNSYYYKNIEQVPIPKLFEEPIFLNEGRNKEVVRFWRKYTAASLIEKLIRQGKEVKSNGSN